MLEQEDSQDEGRISSADLRSAIQKMIDEDDTPDYVGEESEAEKQSVADRIIVVENVYHQPYGQEPYHVDSRFSRVLQTTDEQPYDRRSRVSEDWQSLDMGWLEGNVSLVHITNEEGRRAYANPTEEEKAQVARRVLEISFDKSSQRCLLVSPGESVRIVPSDASSLSIRCQCGTAKYTLRLFPR